MSLLAGQGPGSLQTHPPGLPCSAGGGRRGRAPPGARELSCRHTGLLQKLPPASCKACPDALETVFCYRSLTPLKFSQRVALAERVSSGR